MRWFIFSVLTFWLSGICMAQLVEKRDYDAAFAIQAGGTIALPLPCGNPGVRIMPVGGLKMTFPFNRKWFIGAEINYECLTYKSSYSDVSLQAGDGLASTSEKWALDAALRQLEVPVYVKYMLNCNRASVLLGFYGAYVFYYDVRNGDAEKQNTAAPDWGWNAGVTLGFEYQLVKRLNVMCRVSIGAREFLEKEYTAGKKRFPLQASLILSYDILRIGGCGCD